MSLEANRSASCLHDTPAANAVRRGALGREVAATHKRRALRDPAHADAKTTPARLLARASTSAAKQGFGARRAYCWDAKSRKN